MKVTVTAKHIKYGIARTHDCHPVALAIGEVFQPIHRDVVHVRLADDWAAFTMLNEGYTGFLGNEPMLITVPLSEEVFNWIMEFNKLCGYPTEHTEADANRKKFKPFTFELQVS